jgi:hypothetical protein
MSEFLKKITFFIVISFIGGNSLCATRSYQLDFQKIEQEIEAGELLKAERKLKKIEKSESIGMLEKYKCNKLMTKIYLNQQAFSKYNLEVDKLIHLSKFLNPIYKSEAYAHKAYYWHYMMWSDSALVYSNKSMAIYRKNEKFRTKVEIPFIYEVHAITYLYRTDAIAPKAYLDLSIKDFKRKQFQWFDSALYYHAKFPFKFSTDRSMLYRSYANRWLDEVAGRRPKTPTKMQLIAFVKANDLYNKGIACLKPWHTNDFLILNGLKGAIHTYIHRYKEADEIFTTALNSIAPNTLMDRKKINYHPLMTFLTFRVRNTCKLAYNEQKISNDISLLLKLKYEFWKSFDKTNDLPYDPYRTSPYINLFTLYTLKSQHEPKNKANFSKAVSHLMTLKVYFHFIKNGRQNTKHLPYFDVSKIQKKLKKNDCFLFMHSDSDLLDGKKILITKNNIQFVKSYRICELNNLNIDTLTFNEFKKLSFQAYQDNLKDVLLILPNVKKIYINHDDLIPYEMLLKDSKSQSYASANFAGNQINFVRLYNPYTYFDETTVLQNYPIDVRSLKQKKVSKLHFMDDFFNHFSTNHPYSKEYYQGDLKDILTRKGILHLYGHGEFAFDETAQTFGFQIRYETTGSTQADRQFSGDFICNRELVVLNNCFSGYPFYNINEFNKTIPLRILSNGAKSLICSPNKVDDYYSAEFFKLFYQKIEKGMVYEDAFFEAKQQFIKEHPDMRNPKIWNGLQLIVSYKIHNLPENQNWSGFILLAIISIFDTILTALYVLLHTRKQLRRLTVTPL